ncbi:helix-turn-helix domain-containing protein [Janthinobacterium agaricidamnosum]|uniref:Bacterial regulatory helix-turn-helix s, AraC family protein n=1 Tax=Janthinobacterium agaricidamnosum NBRC 102515 = DSM 9628 TaxID=1349767 RepID=W0V3T1_9BURK|nr:helix-turn-helix domain-containing protein [Janthinobacterium agaricidamnosum]CDG82531.1 bacterial regulatory helix-turn-helix s, AraC family protein [Janthinobacterium agaricidamnosum NBRC 102515 = DSM 9628]
MSALATLRANNDLDNIPQPAIALRAHAMDGDRDPALHRHRKGQLVLALRGSVICEVPHGYWMVPPHCGVWIPGGMSHSMRVTADTDLCLLCVEPAAAVLPEDCCTLTITPLLREMILRLVTLAQSYAVDSPTARLVGVMLDELGRMPIEQLYFPISDHPTLRRLADALLQAPADRRTAREWAAWLALSERTLARLVRQQTGMTFGRWRQQLQIIVALRWLYSGLRVQRVAEDLGYESVSAFITMFKKALGASPAKYLARTAR